MSDLFTHRQVEGNTPLNQAKRAIAHTLQAIADDPRKYDLMGLGTQSYALLTEAAATLWDQPVDDVRRRFIPKQLIEVPGKEGKVS